jgi:hypothetical protein|uniref:Uncharacterized protein n=1 Tax=Picea glauca TaxID=3330 RepID=A0A101LUY8_PICGL|nr:hypothetical protein ABT39_MTgene2188 [Picea glauca]QHR88064.1 hypothetical protein Q903MT_gene2076 [Picea sitchensis]
MALLVTHAVVSHPCGSSPSIRWISEELIILGMLLLGMLLDILLSMLLVLVVHLLNQPNQLT